MGWGFQEVLTNIIIIIIIIIIISLSLSIPKTPWDQPAFDPQARPIGQTGSHLTDRSFWPSGYQEHMPMSVTRGVRLFTPQVLCLLSAILQISTTAWNTDRMWNTHRRAS